MDGIKAAYPHKAGGGMGWKIPNFHIFAHHLFEAIRIWGQIENCSTQKYEASHKHHCKDSFKVINSKIGSLETVVERSARERTVKLNAQEDARYNESNLEHEKDWKVLPPTWRADEQQDDLRRRR